MIDAELLTRWTVRFALGLMVLTVLVRWCRPPTRAWQQLARGMWTVGFLLFLTHVLCAFQFYHAWSHAAAYEETARRTEELTGVYSGDGLYLNYAFTLAWLVDVLWWWRGLEVYRQRAAWVGAVLYSFFAFMAFNATVVFGRGAIRWVGLGVSVALLLAVSRPLVRTRPRNSKQLP